MKQIKTKVYKCTRCGYEWLQRHRVVRDRDDLRIKSIESQSPKNCSRCKSPSCFIPRPL